MKTAEEPVPNRVQYDDPNFERKVLQISFSIVSDVELSDEEDACYNDHETDSAQSADEEKGAESDDQNDGPEKDGISLFFL